MFDLNENVLRPVQLIAFYLADQQIAVPLSVVERTFRAVYVTPLPGAPESVIGVINVYGQIFPVVSLRIRFGFPVRPIRTDDWFIVVKSSKRTMVLLVDSVVGIMEKPFIDFVPVNEIIPGGKYVDGVIRLHDGVLIIHNVRKCLSLEEENKLDDALYQCKEVKR